MNRYVLLVLLRFVILKLATFSLLNLTAAATEGWMWIYEATLMINFIALSSAYDMNLDLAQRLYK